MLVLFFQGLAMTLLGREALLQVDHLLDELLGIATFLGIHWVFAFSGVLLLCLSSAIWRHYRGQRGC